MSSLRRNVEANGIGSGVCLVETAVGSQAGAIRFTVGHDTTNRVPIDAMVSRGFSPLVLGANRPTLCLSATSMPAVLACVGHAAEIVLGTEL